MKKTSSNNKSGTQKHPALRPWMSRVQILSFFFVLIIGTFAGLLFFMRPTESAREKRSLTQFPELTVSALTDGDFWEQISAWYADTFPGRDTWMDVSISLNKLKGIQSVSISSSGKTGDEIPDVNSVVDGDSSTEETSAEESSQTATGDSSQKADSKDESSIKEESASESSADPASESQTDAKAEETSEVDADAIEGTLVDDLYVVGDAAYPRYFFNLENANKYIDTINQLAETLQGQANVYSILVPNSTQLMLDEKTFEALGGSDEKKAIEYYCGSMSSKVTKINAYEILEPHTDEYLYFRSDHHWTQRAAYKVYQEYAKAAGITVNPLSSYDYAKYEPFLGSYYLQSFATGMLENPDYVETWTPRSTNTAECLDPDGSTYTGYVVYDPSAWDENTTYVCFLGGDVPLETIHNPEKSDGSAVLLMKESYGNCFAPFLVDNYEYVYVVDYRYYESSVLDLIYERDIDDVIIMNNLNLISGDYVVGLISDKLQ